MVIYIFAQMVLKAIILRSNEQCLFVIAKRLISFCMYLTMINCHVIPVQFDDDYVQTNVQRLRLFYFKKMIPRIADDVNEHLSQFVLSTKTLLIIVNKVYSRTFYTMSHILKKTSK